MKIKIDENLPNSLALLLQEQEHDVETVKGEGLSGMAGLWQVSGKNELTFEDRLKLEECN